MRASILLWGLFCGLGQLLSQQTLSPEQALTQMQERMNRLQEVELKVNYRIYEGHSSSNLVEEKSAIYRREKKAYSLDFGEMQIFCRGKEYLHIDHDQGMIFYGTDVDDTQMQLAPVSVSQLLKVASKSTMEEGPSILKVRLHFQTLPTADLQQVDYIIDKQSLLLMSVVLYYRRASLPMMPSAPALTTPRLEISYKLLPKSNKPIPFPVDTYLSLGSAKPRLQSPYQHFQLQLLDHPKQ